MAAKKLSEITQGTPSGSDFVVGVTAANQDRLFPVSGLGGNGRTLLTPGSGDPASTRTFYVATTGSDTTGDGTAGNPWATPQFAFTNIAALWDWGKAAVPNPAAPDQITNFGNAIIQMADGTYNVSGFQFGAGAAFYVGTTPWGIPPDKNITWQGNALDPSKVIWNSTNGGTGFWIDGPNVNFFMIVQNITFKGFSVGLQQTYQTTLWVQDCYFDVTHSNNGTDIATFMSDCKLYYTSKLTNGFQITGDRNSHITVNGFTEMNFGSKTTFVGTPNFSGAFINVFGPQGFVRNARFNMSFVGGCTGKRFSVNNGQILGTASKTFFPGSIAGTLAGNGIYT